MRIQNNIMALNAHRQLGNNTNQVSKSLEKLSSGFNINRAGDDAAGLAISEKMRAQIKGLETAQANSQDGISLVQTAEGALTEVHSMLNRMVQLATKSSNGTYMDDDRSKLQKEVDSLGAEIDRISQSVNFNKQNLLDGSLGGGSSAVGATGAIATSAGFNAAFNATISGVVKGTKVSFVSLASTATESTITSAKGVIAISLDGSTTFKQADIDKLIKDHASILPSGFKVNIGDQTITTKSTAGTAAISLTATDPKKAEGTVGGITFQAKNAGARGATIAVTVGAAGPEGVTITKTGNISISLDGSKTYTKDDINKLLSKAGADVVATEVGTPATAMGAALTGGAGAGGVTTGGLILQVGDTGEAYQKLSVSIGDMGTASLGIAGLDISKQDPAVAAIDTINTAINSVSQTRSDLGAVQNRLEHTINNLGVTTENLTSAESRIRDADMAKEMMTFTKDNVLAQAAQAMLAQANQQPQSVLQLLQ